MNSIIAFLMGLWFGLIASFVLFCLLCKDSEDHHDQQ